MKKQMKTTGDLLNYIKDTYKISELKNKELDMLYVFCQEDKKRFLSTLPDRVNHLYKKHLNLYTIQELMDILKTGSKMDSISANLMETLRKCDSEGRIKLNLNIKKTKDLYMKYI